MNIDGAIRFKDGASESALEDPLNREFILGIDWANPIDGITDFSTSIKFDSYEEDKFKGETSEIGIELSTHIIPLTDHLSLSNKQYLDAGVSEYGLSTQLDLPIRLVDYIKADLLHARDEVSVV